LSEIPGLIFPTNRAIHDHLGKMPILTKSPNTDLSRIFIAFCFTRRADKRNCCCYLL